MNRHRHATGLSRRSILSACILTAVLLSWLIAGPAMGHMVGPKTVDVWGVDSKYARLGLNYTDMGSYWRTNHNHVWMGKWGENCCPMNEVDAYRVRQKYDVDGMNGVQNLYY